MKRELVKLKGMEILEVDFNGDMIMCAKLKGSEKVYVGINWITQSIGLTKGQHDNEVKKIQKDLVLSKGTSNLTLPTNGGNQSSFVLEIEYLPMWLAKISITKDMRDNKPETVEKLIEYQIKAKDVLAKAFLGKQEEWNLQREVSKVDRRRLTDSIKVNILDAKFYTYSNYTDLVYQVLFNMKAKELRISRNIEKKSDFC
jgi:hypothetical protein